MHFVNKFVGPKMCVMSLKPCLRIKLFLLSKTVVTDELVIHPMVSAKDRVIITKYVVQLFMQEYGSIKYLNKIEFKITLLNLLYTSIVIHKLSKTLRSYDSIIETSF